MSQPDRLFVIEQKVHALRSEAVLVSADYAPPSLEDDMADIGVAVFGGNPPAPDMEALCG